MSAVQVRLPGWLNGLTVAAELGVSRRYRQPVGLGEPSSPPCTCEGHETGCDLPYMAGLVWPALYGMSLAPHTLTYERDRVT